ncbi:hypothetical protein BDW02DRAFT_649243 [Decorospora gaudefroyi]|uniref:Uncharacterized protein n=1 Tax=Decorospora gaudefroyi TaxID=184978 RepID=A0A6A5K6B8_9PLEO|nr:hypothetical protein BDW02DRAFT_649243 [Decorospora gaudefroyi]
MYIYTTNLTLLSALMNSTLAAPLVTTPTLIMLSSSPNPTTTTISTTTLSPTISIRTTTLTLSWQPLAIYTVATATISTTLVSAATSGELAMHDKVQVGERELGGFVAVYGGKNKKAKAFGIPVLLGEDEEMSSTGMKVD